MADLFTPGVQYTQAQVQPLSHQQALGRGYLGELSSEQWVRFLDLLAQADEDDLEYDGIFNDEYGEDFEYGEDPEYFYPLSQTLSRSDGEDIPEGFGCDICARHQANVRFNCCSHGACIACVKGIWGSQKRFDDHFPTSFPCHQCRTKVTHIHMSRRLLPWGLSNRDRGQDEGVPVVEWMAKRSNRVAQGLKEKRRRSRLKRKVASVGGKIVFYLVGRPLAFMLGVE